MISNRQGAKSSHRRTPLITPLPTTTLLATLTTLLLVLLATHPPATEAHFLDRIMRCILRRDREYVNKTMELDGKVLRCEGFVYYNYCFGRCETAEIGDYKIPFKLSDHRVCTYKEWSLVELTPRHCHPDHPDPGITVYNATACHCGACDAETTSCE